jgi:hypothetical protein
MRKLLVVFAVFVAAALAVLMWVAGSKVTPPSTPDVVDDAHKETQRTNAQPIGLPPAAEDTAGCRMCDAGAAPSRPARQAAGPANAVEALRSLQEGAPGLGDGGTNEHEDVELWDAVQATPAERELARQENERQSVELDKATQDLQSDQMVHSDYVAKLREIGLAHRKRLVEIFGEERANKIRDLRRQQAEQFMDGKYGSR